jgi:hypothetical protein
MSTSPPVRTRQSRRPTSAASKRLPRGESVATVARSILLAVAAVSVIGTSNYFAYMIGRKQATYEELSKQVDRVVQLMNQNQAEEQVAPATVKQQQGRLEQNAPGLIDLTTSTVNGKTTATAPETVPAEKPVSAALIDVPPAAPDEASPKAATKHRAARGLVNQRGSRAQKAPKASSTDAFAQQPGQSTTAAPPPDAGAANQ